MRLIDADVVIERLRIQAECDNCNNFHGEKCVACPWEDAIIIIDDYADNHPAET